MFCDALIFQVYLAQNMTCIVMEHETMIMKNSSTILYDIANRGKHGKIKEK